METIEKWEYFRKSLLLEFIELSEKENTVLHPSIGRISDFPITEDLYREEFDGRKIEIKYFLDPESRPASFDYFFGFGPADTENLCIAISRADEDKHLLWNIRKRWIIGKESIADLEISLANHQRPRSE